MAGKTAVRAITARKLRMIFKISRIFVDCKFKKNSHIKKHLYTIILATLVVAFTGLTVFGQNPRGNRRQRVHTAAQDTAKPQVPDSTAIKDSLPAGDTLSLVRDSLSLRRDSLNRAKADSLDLLEKSSISRPAFSAAKDSSRQVFADGQRKMFYWGDVEVTYENIKLKADYMEYDMNTGTVFARGTYDSLSQSWKGQP